MLIGYTFLDPLIVAFFVAIAIFLLSKDPVHLIGWMPSILSFYFFIPTFTLLTPWQVILPALTLRSAFSANRLISREISLIINFSAVILVLSAGFALFFGDDPFRSLIKLIYYIGILGLFAFAYEAGRHKRGYRIFLKGLVITGLVLALYGVYQILAVNTGLPFRAIVRGVNFAQMAYESGIPRINSFASEPKRLGYVLFVCGLAALFISRRSEFNYRNLDYLSIMILIISLFTFSGSYYSSVILLLFACGALYPGKTGVFAVAIFAVLGVSLVLFPEGPVFDAVSAGFSNRFQELEVGSGGDVVYRQEFFAWDYLTKYPTSILTGLGVGQYNNVLFKEYGSGVGIDKFGSLLPLNSTVLELIFDFGIFVTVIFYLSVLSLIMKLRQANESYICISLLFLLIQSISILTLPFLVLFAGIGIGRLDRVDKSTGAEHG